MNRYKYTDEKREHLHTLEGQPLIGTSSVSNVLAKPLTWWASGLAVKEFGCQNPKLLTLIKNKDASEEQEREHMVNLGVMQEKIKQMTVEEYAKLVDSAYRAHTKELKKKAGEGTDLHAELERFVKDEIAGEQRIPEAYNIRILPFISWARENIKRYLWSEMNCYSEKYWIGGITDLGYEKHDGTIGIMDFKSSKEAYLSQFWQCAGYDLQISENGGYTASGDKVFGLGGRKITEYAILPFGMENPYPQFNVDIEGGREAFLCELTLYKKMPRD